MRKVKDYYFNKAKKEKYPARSVYKLEEVQKKYNLLHPGDIVLDLGCQPGSWSQYAAEIVGRQGKVVGVDLQIDKKPNRGQGGEIVMLAGDVMDPEIVVELAKMQASFKVVMSDMAPRTSGNKWVDQQLSLRLSRRTLEIAEDLLCEGGNFYCKVFQGEDFTDFFQEVRARFKMAKTVKPKSSRTESREVFLLGMGFIKVGPSTMKNEEIA